MQMMCLMITHRGMDTGMEREKRRGRKKEYETKRTKRRDECAIICL